MKKVFSLALALLLVLALTACGADQNKADEPTPPGVSEAGPPAEVIPEQPQVPSESENQEQEEQSMDTAKRIRFLVGEDEIVVRLEDNPAAESLYEMLPMELNFEDYNNTEKIAYPDETLIQFYDFQNCFFKPFCRKFCHQNSLTSRLQTGSVFFQTENTYFTIFSTECFQSFKGFLTIV